MPNCSGLPFDYTELNKSCTESYTLENGWASQRIFQGDWVTRFDFIDAVFARVSSAGGQQTATNPAVYPDIPAAKPHSAKIEGKFKVGHAGTDNQASYDKAKIIVDYKILPYNIGGLAGVTPDPADPTTITYITEEFDTEIEMVRIPSKVVSHWVEQYSQTQTGQGVFTLVETPETIPERNIMESIINYRLTHHFVQYPNWQAISAGLGKINREDFYTPSGLVAPIGTILYNGPSGLRRHSTSRDPKDYTWEITHDFKYNRHGWNFTYNAEQDRYVLVVLNAGLATEAHLYKPFTMQNIFQIAPTPVTDIKGRTIGFVGYDPETGYY